MKQINTYINEKLRLTSKRTYTCQPKAFSELRTIIFDRIENEGPTCDLNDIDISKIDNISYLFDAGCYTIFKDFNGDISQWNVSNVKSMNGMFFKCENFNCDLSMWNVSNVIDMGLMFYGCKKFNQDLSQWDVSNVKNMYAMFYNCKKFNQDLNSWDISSISNANRMVNTFKNCPTQPEWYINKIQQQ